MKVKTLVFRYRVVILVAIYALGFLAPWRQLFSSQPETTLWLTASTWLARVAGVGVQIATLTVTIAALACCWAGAALRLWGTAFLGSWTMRDRAMHGEQLVAVGPYRYVRNPLYIGSFLLAAGISVLMPWSGAPVFLLVLLLLQWTLIRGEEAFLAEKLGEPYLEYRRHVPRILPRLHAGTGPSAVRPRWWTAALAEIWPLSFALCFTTLAWRYDAWLLMKCLIVCYGLSLVARAALPKPGPAGEAAAKQTKAL